jgi:hypothetical protein
MDVETDATCILGDGSAVTKCLIDPGDAVLTHCEQIARGQLRAWRPGIKESGSGMRQELLREKIIGLEGSIKIL